MKRLLVTAFLYTLALAVLAPMPGGFMVEPEQIHHVPNEAVIELNQDGSHTTVLPDGTEYFTAAPQTEEEHLQHKRDYGWVSSAWQSGRNFSDFVAQWTVPPVPSQQSDNQTIFFFNSWSSSGILQPVLQWGTSAAGGWLHKWSFASYYVVGHFMPTFKVSPIVEVQPGDQLTGLIQLQADGSVSVKCYINKVLTGNLIIKNSGWYGSAQVALEVYGVMKCTDYPPNGNLVFSNMRLRDRRTTVTSPWSIDQGPSAECGKCVCPSYSTCTISY